MAPQKGLMSSKTLLKEEKTDITTILCTVCGFLKLLGTIKKTVDDPRCEESREVIRKRNAFKWPTIVTFSIFIPMSLKGNYGGRTLKLPMSYFNGTIIIYYGCLFRFHFRVDITP